MKRFEFRLQRVLELRKQQAELERSRLAALAARVHALDQEKQNLTAQLTDATDKVTLAEASYGEDWVALHSFQRHVSSKCAELDLQEKQLAEQIAVQRSVVAESDRRVKLLEKLRAKRLVEWTVGRDQELETLAAESYLARMLAGRRSRQSDQDANDNLLDQFADDTLLDDLIF